MSPSKTQALNIIWTRTRTRIRRQSPGYRYHQRRSTDRTIEQSTQRTSCKTKNLTAKVVKGATSKVSPSKASEENLRGKAKAKFSGHIERRSWIDRGYRLWNHNDRRLLFLNTPQEGARLSERAVVWFDPSYFLFFKGAAGIKQVVKLEAGNIWFGGVITSIS